jgi:hypothetical protein
MKIISGTSEFYILAVVLSVGFVLAVAAGIKFLNWREWIACLLGISSITILVLGNSRIYSREGCISGLHGIPFLEAAFPYVSLGLFTLAAAVAILDYRIQKYRTGQSS